MASKQELIDYVADRTELSKVNAAKAIIGVGLNI